MRNKKALLLLSLLFIPNLFGINVFCVGARFTRALQHEQVGARFTRALQDEQAGARFTRGQKPITQQLKTKYNPQIHHRRSIRLKGYDYSQAGAYFITICCQDKECRFGKIENDEMILDEFGTIAYNEWNKLAERFPNFELDVFQIMPNHMHGIIVLNDVGAGFTPARDRAGFIPARDPAGFIPARDPVGFTATRDPGGFTAARDPGGFTAARDPAGFTAAETSAGFTTAQNGPGFIAGETGPGFIAGENNKRAGASPAPTGNIVGAYKSLVANECLKIFKSKWAGVNEAGVNGAGASPAPTMGKLWQRNYYEHIIRNEQSYQTISNYIISNTSKWKDDKFYSE